VTGTCARSLPRLAVILSVGMVACAPSQLPRGFSALAPAAYCRLPCGSRWVAVPEQCPAASRPVSPPTSPSRGSLSGLVVAYLDVTSPGHDASRDASPARDVLVTVSTQPIDGRGPLVPAQSAMTGNDGRYLIHDLAPGPYHAAILRRCGGQVIVMDVVVRAGETTNADFRFGEDTPLQGETAEVR
jgi:hypothetical protein